MPRRLWKLRCAELSDVVDIKILVDDSSRDQTAMLSSNLGVKTFVHDANYGYGRNQQTCYREALAAGADIVVMVHPDYQYTPLLVPAMSGMIASGVYDMVLASRILGGGALQWRDASLQVHFQPFSHGISEPVSRRKAVANTTPGFVPSRANCLRRFRCWRTRMISSSTTR